MILHITANVQSVVVKYHGIGTDEMKIARSVGNVLIGKSVNDMARYIDADALIEVLKNPPLHHSLVKITLDDVIAMVEEQTTAFDMDDIVERLEENLLVVEIEDEHIISESDVEEYFELEVVPMDIAIDIVRNAGKDGGEP